MSQLGKNRKTTEIKLPSYPEDTVVLYSTPLTYEVREATASENDDEKGLQIVKCLIKSWTFTNEDGTPLEITKDNILKLELNDFVFLSNKANELMADMGPKKEQS